MSDLRPILIETIQLNADAQTFERKLVEGADAILRCYFKQGVSPADLTGSTITAYIANSDATVVRSFSGTIIDAEGGQVDIDLEGDDIDFSGDGYDFSVKLVDSDGNEIYQRLGDLEIFAKVPESATPVAGSVIDWSAFTGYANGLTDGPIVAGTRLIASEDVLGQVTFDVDVDGIESDLTGKQDVLAEGAFVDGDKTKLDWIEAGADVTANNTAADVDPAGMAIAAALANKLDLTGESTQSVEGELVVEVLRTSGGSAIGTNVFSGGSLNAQDKGQIRISASGPVLESLVGGEHLYLRGRTTGAPTGDVYIGDLGGTVYIPLIQALAGGVITLKDNAGTTQATVSSTGLALTTDLAITEGGTGASTAQSALINLSGTNVETLSGNKTLTTSDVAYQDLDPNGADRDVDLPTTGRFVITNTGSANDLLVYESDSATLVDTIEPGVSLTFISTATDTWSVK